MPGIRSRTSARYSSGSILRRLHDCVCPDPCLKLIESGILFACGECGGRDRSSLVLARFCHFLTFKGRKVTEIWTSTYFAPDKKFYLPALVSSQKICATASASTIICQIPIMAELFHHAIEKKPIGWDFSQLQIF